MSACSRSLLTLAALGGAVGCSDVARVPAAPLKPALTSPAEGGAPWRELVTPHFVLDTDLSASDARERIADYERSQEVLLEHLHAPAPAPTRVVLFARWRDFAKLNPDSSDYIRGYFNDGGDAVHRQPLIVMHAGSATLFRHELFHRFFRERIPDPPTWLDEGLAVFYSTIAVEKDRVVVGERGWPRGRSVELPVLFAAAPNVFSGPQGQAYDDTAAALVSLLRDRSWPYHERFDRYVDALVAGTQHEAAWAESFGDVSLRRLQEDLWIYRRELRVDTIEASPHRAPDPPPPTVRVLSDGEVHVLWLLLRR